MTTSPQKPMQKLTIPELHPFIIPDGATIASMQTDLPIPYRYREMLREKCAECWEEIPLTSKSKRGGFIPLGMFEYVSTRDAFTCVEELAEQHGRSFYCGSVLDAFCYISQNCPHPKHFNAFGPDCASVLKYVTYENGDMFLLASYGCTWRSTNIFIVEDL